MPSKSAALVFPKKGDATPPPDAAGRTAQADPLAVATSTPPAAAAAPTDLAGILEAGGDDLVQINVTVPRRIRNALHLLKLTGQTKSAKEVTTAAITKAVEQLLVDAGKVGR